VLDVLAKLCARARMVPTGQGRDTDVIDAYSVAVVGLRPSGLLPVRIDAHLVALRMLAVVR
jgi:hypothetical protein